MIVIPRNPKEWQAATVFLGYHSHVAPSADMKIIGWTEEDHLKLVVGFNGFIGRVCQIHVAMASGYHFTPRKMLEATFDYAFNQLGREKIIGVVNSRNARALRYDLHLGFVEEHRMPGVHDDGGDLIILGMTRSQCRYLTKQEAA